MKIKTGKAQITMIFLFIIICLTFTGCGGEITVAEMAEIESEYERGEISFEYYLEVTDAYLNGEPMPPKTFIGKIWRGITNFFTSVVGFIFEVIGLIVIIFILRYIFGGKNK